MKKLIFPVLIALLLVTCGTLEEKTKNKVAISQLLEDFKTCKKENKAKRRIGNHYT